MTTDLAIQPVETVTEAPSNDVADVVETPEPSEAQTDDAVTEPVTKEVKPELTEVEKVKHAMQKRIDKLTAKSSQTEQQYQNAIQELEKYKQPQANDSPKEDDFETVEDYLKAVGRWEAKQETAKAEQEKRQTEAKTAYEAKISAKRAEFEGKEAEMRKTTHDYDETVQVLNEHVDTVDKNSPGFQVFRDVLMGSNDMAAMSYHLGKNPELLESMQKMEPLQIARTLFRLELDLENAPKATAKATAAPPTPIKGKGVMVSEDTMSGKELLKKHKLL
jgi:hypothetical protein